MDFVQVISLSIVEGITEFLPISSTGHLILASKLLSIPQTEFVKTFEIVIQLGAILSIVFLYGKRLLTDSDTLKRVVWVSIPTGGLGFLLYKMIKEFLIGNLLVTIFALIIGGVAIIFIEKFFKTREKQLTIANLTIRQSLILGVIQTLSVIPGVSRSATTIFGGMSLGLSRKEATELSFLVALPIMFAATGLDLFKSSGGFSGNEWMMLIAGMIISFIVAVASIRWLLNYVKDHNFIVFGIYRIIIGIFFLIFVS